MRASCAAALALAAACSRAGPCSTDADCPTAAVCAAPLRGEGAGSGRRCLATCVGDADCALSFRLGTRCQPLQDDSTGPATMEPRRRITDRANVDPTARGAIRVCRSSSDEVAR